MNKNAINQLLVENRLDEAIPEMLALAQGSPYIQDTQLLSARYHEYVRQQRLNIEPPAELERKRNRLTKDLLELLAALPDHPSSSDVRPVLTTPGNGNSPPVSGRSKTNFWIRLLSVAFVLVLLIYLKQCCFKQNGNGDEVAVPSDSIADLKSGSSGSVDRPVTMREKPEKFHSGPVAKENPTPELISGTVTDQHGRRLPGVRIQVENCVTTTDSNGYYKLYIPPGGKKPPYLLDAWKVGFQISPPREVWPTGEMNFPLTPDLKSN